MTNDDRMELLRRAVRQEGSQAAVARKLGYKPTTISLVLGGKYPGDASLVLSRVEEVYGGRVVDCPVLGEIPLSRCADERIKPFAASNPVRVRLFRACRECRFNPAVKEW